jgi:hypothetical protein
MVGGSERMYDTIGVEVPGFFEHAMVGARHWEIDVRT